MNFFKKLFGSKETAAPTWNVKPAAERPAPRARKVESHADTAPLMPAKAPNPFLDDPMLDTMTLKIEALEQDEDPYRTSSWKLDPDSDTRKLKTIAFGEKTEKSPAARFNPYDTGKMRRGWKK